MSKKQISPESAVKVLMPDGSLALLYTIEDAADLIGYSRRHTRLLCDIGRLPSLKLGGRWFVIIEYEEVSRERIDIE